MILDDSNDHDRSRDKNRHEDRLLHRVLPYVLTGFIGGGGFSIAMPQLWPQLYRNDPFTGDEGEQLTRQVLTLEAKVDQFLIIGPELVRQNQRDIISTLKEISQLMNEMQKAQLRHFDADKRGMADDEPLKKRAD